MVDTFVNVNLASGSGVDTRLLFPGSTAAETAAATLDTDNGTATLYINDVHSGIQYEIDYTGKNFSFTSVGGGNISGNLSGETLYTFDAGGNKIKLATLFITDENGNSKTVAMASALDFTQNTPQNSFPSEVAQLTETGDSGADKLYGSEYNDVLSGYGGHDTLTGGGGNDRFVFISSASSTYDFVTDFTRGHDKLDLDAGFSNFPGLRNSNLASVFHDITHSSETASDRLLYNRDTGALFYDRDGAGGRDPTEIAVLTNHAHINYSDIKVIH